MFEHVEKLPDDPILKLSGLYRDDPRAEKIDVGVGVFKNEQGVTPIMRAVKLAEQDVHDQQTTKAYVGVLGNVGYNRAIMNLVLGDAYDESRFRAVQSAAGTGALRVLGELLRHVKPDATIWISEPTWGNHLGIFKSCNLAIKRYPYFDTHKRQVNFEAFFDTVSTLGSNDVLLLHGCCHNPSGSDLSPEQWDRLADLAAEKGFLPFVDLAYQGFGTSLEQDVYGVRQLARKSECLLLAASSSKNFGLYRERVGCAIVSAQNATIADALHSHMKFCTRTLLSMPPDHGASIVEKILTTPEYKQMWLEELQSMCKRILNLRQELRDALRAAVPSHEWDFITEHKGMFTLLCFDDETVLRLREECGIYMVNGGRINMAGFKNKEQIQYFADSVAKILPKA